MALKCAYKIYKFSVSCDSREVCQNWCDHEHRGFVLHGKALALLYFLNLFLFFTESTRTIFCVGQDSGTEQSELCVPAK